MKNKLLKFLLFLGSGIFCSPSFAVNTYEFEEVPLEKWTSQLNVRSIFQDSYGIMWLGIESSGLSKYDGKKFTTFTHTDTDTTSISINYINEIAEDANGDLWIATEKGLNIFLRGQNRFKKFFYPEINANIVQKITKDAQGNIWVGTSKGLMKFVPSTKNNTEEVFHEPGGTKVSYKLEENFITERLEGKYIYSILKEDSNTLWVGTNDGLYLFDLAQERTSYWHQIPFVSTTLSNSIVTAITKITDRYYVIGTDEGVNLLDKKANSFKTLEFNRSGIFKGGIVGISGIYKDSKGVLWIGTNSYGIVTGPVTNISPDNAAYFKTPTSIDGITSKHIQWVCEDNTDQVWIATKFGGAFKYDRRQQMFPKYTLKYTKYFGQGINFLLSVEESRHPNIVWMGTKGGGLVRYNIKTHKHQEIKVRDYDEEYLRRIECLYEDAEGNVWIGHKYGVIRLDNNYKQQHNYYLPKVYQIVKDSTGQMWLGTIKGLYYYDKQKDDFIRYGQSALDIFVRDDFTVSVIYPDSQGKLWIGTDTHGLFVYNQQKNALKNYTNTPGKSNSLSGNIVRSIFEDDQGNIWVGTKSSGLNMYRADIDGFDHLKESDGLTSNTIFAMVQDDQGNIWIMTNNGISRYNPGKKTFTNFNEGHGLQGNIFERRTSVKLQDGRILTGGFNGFNLFEPEKIEGDNFTPPLTITEVKVNDEPLQYNIFDHRDFDLSHNAGVISLEFASLDYRNPSAIQYAYKLSGVDQQWVHSGNRNYVTYSKLSHGTYTFQFKATNADGIWAEEPLSVDITISRPPWLTAWAYASYVAIVILFLLGLIYLVILRANYFHQLKNKELEIKRNEELHQLKLRFFTNVSHELRTPLALILAPLEKLMHTDLPDSVKRKINLAQQSTKRLMRLTDQLLYFRKAEQANLALQVSHGDIIGFINGVSEPFFELAEKNKIDFQINPEINEFSLWFDPEKIEKIVNNLLYNAFKFTPSGGTVELVVHGLKDQAAVNHADPTVKKSISRVQEYFKISIRDTGKGMNENQLKNIFNRFYQAEPFEVGTGIGLELVKMLIDVHKGDIEVSSSPQTGTCFTIYLPASEDFYTEEEMATKQIDGKQYVSWVNSDDLVEYDDGSGDENEVIAERKHKLLIVEDNRDLRRFLKDSLSENYFVTTVNDGEEAFKEVVENHPDLIISDIMMSKMDGLSLCKALKSDVNTSHIPVILLSAKSMDDQVVEGYELGADDYITKPFDFSLLQARIKNLLINRENLVRKIRDELIVEPPVMTTTATDERFLDKILEIIEKNYKKTDFNVEEFAYDLNMSRSQLFRKVKSLTDQTPSEFLYSFRLKRAINLLISTDYTISQIADHTGFKTANSFTKTFTKHMGVSPKKYKENVATNLA